MTWCCHGNREGAEVCCDPAVQGQDLHAPFLERRRRMEGRGERENDAEEGEEERAWMEGSLERERERDEAKTLVATYTQSQIKFHQLDLCNSVATASKLRDNSSAYCSIYQLTTFDVAFPQLLQDFEEFFHTEDYNVPAN